MLAVYDSNSLKAQEKSNAAKTIVLSSSHLTTSLSHQEQLAGQRELCAAIDVHDTPVSLVASRSAITNGVRFPGLVECFENKDVDTPCQHAADSTFEVGLCVLRACNGGAVV